MTDDIIMKKQERLKRLNDLLDQQYKNLRLGNPKGIIKKNIEWEIVELKEEIKRVEFGDPATWNTKKWG
jgi:hypothetical protein